MKKILLHHATSSTIGKGRPTGSGFLAASLGLLSAIANLEAAAMLPFYEPFPSTYTENENLGAAGSSGNVWNYGNSVSSSSARIVSAAALSYPGFTGIAGQ
jgi:hypothetical protein